MSKFTGYRPVRQRPFSNTSIISSLSSPAPATTPRTSHICNQSSGASNVPIQQRDRLKPFCIPPAKKIDVQARPLTQAARTGSDPHCLSNHTPSTAPYDQTTHNHLCLSINSITVVKHFSRRWPSTFQKRKFLTTKISPTPKTLSVK